MKNKLLAIGAIAAAIYAIFLLWEYVAGKSMPASLKEFYKNLNRNKKKEEISTTGTLIARPAFSTYGENPAYYAVGVSPYSLNAESGVVDPTNDWRSTLGSVANRILPWGTPRFNGSINPSGFGSN